MAIFYVSSGTGTSFSATISITYPAGSTCTVSNYEKTWTAPNTSGSWTFKANDVGYYTVKAVSGSKSKEKEVIITTEGQVETVAMMYDLVLFDNGVVSGYAWGSSNNNGYGDAKVSNGLIYLYGYTWGDDLSLHPGWGEIGISSAINLSDYSTLKVRLKKTEDALGTVTIQVGTTALGDNTKTKNVNLTAGTTTSLDISSITGSKYISLYTESDTDTYGNMIKAYFDKVWLE